MSEDHGVDPRLGRHLGDDLVPVPIDLAGLSRHYFGGSGLLLGRRRLLSLGRFAVARLLGG